MRTWPLRGLSFVLNVAVAVVVVCILCELKLARRHVFILLNINVLKLAWKYQSIRGMYM